MIPTIGQSNPGVCDTLAGLFAHATKSTATLNPMPTSSLTTPFEETRASQNSPVPKNRPVPKSVTKINNRARKAQAKKAAKAGEEVIKNEDSEYSSSDTDISPQLNPKIAPLKSSPVFEPAVAAPPGFLPTTTMMYCGRNAGSQPPQQLNPVVAMLFKQQVDNINMPAWLLN